MDTLGGVQDLNIADVNGDGIPDVVGIFGGEDAKVAWLDGIGQWGAYVRGNVIQWGSVASASGVSVHGAPSFDGIGQCGAYRCGNVMMCVDVNIHVAF